MIDMANSDCWMSDRIDAYLDGDLTIAERERFERLLAEDDRCAKEVALAERIRNEFHLIPEMLCPPYVVQAVLDQTHKADRQEGFAAWSTRIAEWLHAVWQPSLAMGLLLAIVVSGALIGRPAQPAASDEVAYALAEVKWTLAYLSDVGKQTGESVRRDVLEAHVVQPVYNALGLDIK